MGSGESRQRCERRDCKGTKTGIRGQAIIWRLHHNKRQLRMTGLTCLREWFRKLPPYLKMTALICLQECFLRRKRNQECSTKRMSMLEKLSARQDYQNQFLTYRIGSSI